jgi:hypothetical protein
MAAVNALNKNKKPTSSTIMHHPDGSHTVTHTHEDGSTHPNSGAAADLDGVHNKFQETFGGKDESE